MKTLGVFGSWRPQSRDSEYRIARKVGKVATKLGWTILTGGYSGIMEAACRGSVEAGGFPIGVTCPEIDSMLVHNQWVRERIQANSLPIRQATCLSQCQAVLFFPGRTGTAAELALATELRSKDILKTPIILIGNFWEPFFEWLESSNNMLAHKADKPSEKRLFVIASSIRDVMRYLSEVSN
ncbi:MAG: LOG family protein [Desulfuromonadaceae bacterium]